MDAKLKIYPGVARGAVSFFYKDFELYQVADISMMRRDVIACFECREFSAPLQCQYKMFVIGTNNRGVHAEENFEQGQHDHRSSSKISLIRANYRMWMLCAVELDFSSSFVQLHRDVLTSMRLSGTEIAHIIPINDQFRNVLQERREGARRRGWSLGWDSESPEPMMTPANEDDLRFAALSRQLKRMFEQEREVHDAVDVPQVQGALPVANLNLEDPTMDVVVEDMAPLDGNGEILSVTDVDPLAQGNAGMDPTAAVVHVLGRPTRAALIPVRCCLCLGPRATVAVVGCGHVCICTDCSSDKELALHFCPVCRGGLVTKDRNLVIQNLF